MESYNNAYSEFSEIYDKLINYDIDYKNYGDKILKIYHHFSKEHNSYLDLACGTGNLTKVLSKYFSNSFAVDISLDMLSIAEDKFKKENIKCKLINQNIANINLNNQFNLITCFLDGTNYLLKLKDLNGYFRNIYNHLKSDGIFIFDISSSYKIKHILGDNIYTFDDENIFYIWENSLKDDIVTIGITFFVKSKNGLYKRINEYQRQRAYSQNEIEVSLRENNLKILCKLNDYEDKLVCDKTERIVYVVSRR